MNARYCIMKVILPGPVSTSPAVDLRPREYLLKEYTGGSLWRMRRGHWVNRGVYPTEAQARRAMDDLILHPTIEKAEYFDADGHTYLDNW